MKTFPGDRLKKKILTTLALVLLIPAVFLGSRNGGRPHAPSRPEVEAPSPGKVVMTSRQTAETPDPSEEPAMPVPAAARPPPPGKRLVPEVENSQARNPSAGAAKPAPLRLNGKAYTWLPALAARTRDEGDAPSEGPDGYEIYPDTVSEKNFGTFNHHALFVVKDGSGLHKKVITGAFVVITSEISGIESLARTAALDVTYVAAPLGMAILQARDGQDLLEKEVLLKSAPGVRQVTMEILGAGVGPR
jgi:hypothetical protein